MNQKRKSVTNGTEKLYCHRRISKSVHSRSILTTRKLGPYVSGPCKIFSRDQESFSLILFRQFFTNKVFRKPLYCKWFEHSIESGNYYAIWYNLYLAFRGYSYLSNNELLEISDSLSLIFMSIDSPTNRLVRCVTT